MQEFPRSIHSQLVELDHQRRELSAYVLAVNTRKAYQHDWKLFTAWCAEYTRCPQPASADTLSLFLTAQISNGLKITTARRRLTSITHHHQADGIELPDRFKAVQLLRSAQRQRAERPRRARPLEISELRQISELLQKKGTPAAIRDRAMLLVGFASALRRSSIVALTLDDLEFTDDGVILTIVREKQDQEARGRYIAIPHGKHQATCAVQTLRNWLTIRPEAPNRQAFVRVAKGRQHVGLRPDHIANIVKRGIMMLGRDPRPYSGHSLRSGLITAAGEQGLSELQIAEQSGHRSMTVLRTYLRRVNAFRANACAALDL